VERRELERGLDEKLRAGNAPVRELIRVILPQEFREVISGPFLTARGIVQRQVFERNTPTRLLTLIEHESSQNSTVIRECR